MTPDEAIARAREIAEQNGWTWYEPPIVVRERAWVFFGRRFIRVTSTALSLGLRGPNLFVLFDAATGDVVRARGGGR